MSNGLYWEQIVFECFIEGRILAANPFQHHCRMFFFLVAVMGEDCSQLFVSTCIDPLAIPVNRFKSFHQRDDRTMHIARFITEFGNGFMIAFVRRIRVPFYQPQSAGGLLSRSRQLFSHTKLRRTDNKSKQFTRPGHNGPRMTQARPASGVSGHHRIPRLRTPSALRGAIYSTVVP